MNSTNLSHNANAESGKVVPSLRSSCIVHTTLTSSLAIPNEASVLVACAHTEDAGFFHSLISFEGMHRFTILVFLSADRRIISSPICLGTEAPMKAITGLATKGRLPQCLSLVPRAVGYPS